MSKYSEKHSTKRDCSVSVECALQGEYLVLYKGEVLWACELHRKEKEN